MDPGQVGLMWLLIMASLNITMYWELQIRSEAMPRLLG